MYKIYKKIIKENVSNQIQFIKPTLDREFDKLEKLQIEKLIDIKKLVHAFLEKGSLEILTEDEWKTLENSESFGINSYDEVVALSQEYGKDLINIERVFTEGGKLEAPSILYFEEQNPYLVSGDTRLMYMRAIGIDPIVWKFVLEK